MLGFYVVEDVADRAPLGEMAALDGKVLLQRLMAVLGLTLSRLRPSGLRAETFEPRAFI